MKRSLTVLIAALTAAASAQQPAPPAGQPQTFKSGVQTVEVDVRVFDKSGQFVTNLKADDFEVIEDGVPQKVQTAFFVGGPGGQGAGEPRDPANARDPAALPTPRLPGSPSARQTWIFVFDLNHLTPGNGFDRARKAVEDFIAERWKEGDLAGVVAGSKMVNNRLTSVRRELADAVKSVKPRAELRSRKQEMTQEWPPLLDEFEVMQIAAEDREAINRATIRATSDGRYIASGKGGVPPDLEVREKARRLSRDIVRMTTETMASLNALASGLARMPGPKTVVFLSEGFVTQQMEATLRNVVGQTARAGARIYAIDVRGLNRNRSNLVEQGAAIDEAGPYSRFDAGADATNSLAVDTGGLMIRNENNIGRALERIAADSGQYYVLGYSPANTNFDGKYRQIDVRVKRPDVRVRARKGYLALEPAKMLTAGSPGAGEPGGRGAGVGAEARSPKAAEPAGPGAGVPEEPEKPAVTVTGTIATPPKDTPAAGTVRLRPDAEKQVETLAKGATMSAGDFARKGWDAYQKGDVESALTAFTEAAAQPDTRPWVLYALGLSNAAVGRPADAAAAWEQVRTAAPEFEAVYIDLADAYLQMAEASKALAVLRDAEKRWPGDTEVLNAIGVIHVRRGALDDAISAFGKAIEAAPADPLGYFNRGKAYELRFVRGQRYVSSQREWVSSEPDRDKAEENYKKCIELGGPYATEAKEALSRLMWSKK